MTSDVLAAIDRTLDGLCPCGAPPREGSAYCGPDCEPTHISIHTDQRQSGDYATPMRWRPDLVTEADDDDLLPLGSTTFYEGRHHAQLFERRGQDVWHLRLDDGCRFVGADLDGVGDRIDDDLIRRVGETWAKLERELGNTRHLVADDDPWADVYDPAAQLLREARQRRATEARERREAERQALWERVAEWLSTNNIDSSLIPSDSPIFTTTTEIVVGINVTDDAGRSRVNESRGTPLRTTLRVPLIVPWPEDLRYERHIDVDRAREMMAQLGRNFTTMVQHWTQVVQPAFGRMAAEFAKLGRQVQAANIVPASPPPHPMLAAIEARRNRNTGPAAQPLDPRRRHRR